MSRVAVYRGAAHSRVDIPMAIRILSFTHCMCTAMLSLQLHL